MYAPLRRVTARAGCARVQVAADRPRSTRFAGWSPGGWKPGALGRMAGRSTARRPGLAREHADRSRCHYLEVRATSGDRDAHRMPERAPCPWGSWESAPATGRRASAVQLGLPRGESFAGGRTGTPRATGVPRRVHRGNRRVNVHRWDGAPAGARIVGPRAWVTPGAGARPSDAGPVAMPAAHV